MYVHTQIHAKVNVRTHTNTCKSKCTYIHKYMQ